MFRIPDETKTIRAQLLTAMKEGEYANCDRLPRESVLSELLGISRTQLRDILALAWANTRGSLNSPS